MKFTIALSYLLGSAVAQIEPNCRCTCNMRPLVPEVVCSTEDLSTLCKAVSSLPDVAEALSRTDLKYTIFAPNDAGWGNLMLIHDNLLDEPEVLTNLLLNHVVVGFEPICSEDLVCGNLLFMANSSEKGQRTKTACSFGDDPSGGDDAKPEDGEEPTAIYQKGDRNGSSKGNMPEIIGPDTRAKNGVIHIINNVILQKDSFPGEDADDDVAPPPSDDDQAPGQCSGGKECGACKGECQNNDGCRFSKTGWCKRDCEERFGNPETCLCEGGGGDDDQSAAKVCCGGSDCFSCQNECAEFEGCGRESTAECQNYCEEKWGGCQCTGGTSCGECKGECQNNDGCRFSKTGYCKRDCEERFPVGTPEACVGGDDSASTICFGGESCGSCKRECQDNEGCGRESTGQCKGYCQEKWGKC